MTAPKGWCPSIWRPMPTEDGLLARLRPHMNRLTATQALEICDLAETTGSGLLDLTNRASLQLRGLRPDTHGTLLDGLRALDLLDPNLDTETRRSLLVTPFWQPNDMTHRLATAFRDRLQDVPKLPAKCGTVIDTGPTPCLTDTPGDIRIERSTTGLIVRADGSPTGLPVTEDTAIDAAINLAHWFNTHRTPDRRRMAHVVAHTPLPDTYTGTAPRPATKPTHPFTEVSTNGRITAAALRDLLTTSRATALRLTPWRSLLLENAAPNTPTALPYVHTVTEPL
ncbi:MAG: cobalamin biosynthesis protein CobG [Pseudomonadota bacterium]